MGTKITPECKEEVLEELETEEILKAEAEFDEEVSAEFWDAIAQAEEERKFAEEAVDDILSGRWWGIDLMGDSEMQDAEFDEAIFAQKTGEQNV